MSYKSKYVIVDTGTFALPVVFPDLIAHDEIVRGLPGETVLGAGFCFINEDGHYQCYGRSVSLDVESRGSEDARILNKYLGVIFE